MVRSESEKVTGGKLFGATTFKVYWILSFFPQSIYYNWGNSVLRMPGNFLKLKLLQNWTEKWGIS